MLNRNISIFSKQLFFILVLCTLAAMMNIQVWAQDKPGTGVIYGNDDRQNEFQITEKNYLEIGESTLVLVHRNDITQHSDGTFTLDNDLFGDDGYLGFSNACSSERFTNEPAPGFCSGFLVAPDMIATAAHCIREANPLGLGPPLNDIFFVFVMNGVSNPVLNYDEDDKKEVYRARQLGASIYNLSTEEDWALVQLDRVVTNHLPLAIRDSGQISNNQQVHVIGHPSGLPRKYVGGANVRSNTNTIFFEINSDTYHANSGSAVFNDNNSMFSLDALVVEGILVRGEPDFEAGDDDGDGINDCWRSDVLPNNYTTGNAPEDATRSTRFFRNVPKVIFVGPTTSLICMLVGDDGSRTCRFDTVSAGINSVPSRDGTLIVQAGNYSERLTIDDPVTLYSRGGVVQIGN